MAIFENIPICREPNPVGCVSMTENAYVSQDNDRATGGYIHRPCLANDGVGARRRRWRRRRYGWRWYGRWRRWPWGRYGRWRLPWWRTRQRRRSWRPHGRWIPRRRRLPRPRISRSRPRPRAPLRIRLGLRLLRTVWLL